MAAKKKNHSKQPETKVNKSEFVRSMGDIPAKDVIAAAKSKGFTLTPAHVYAIRSKRNADAAKANASTRPENRAAVDHAADRAPASTSPGTFDERVRAMVREEVRSLLHAV